MKQTRTKKTSFTIWYVHLVLSLRKRGVFSYLTKTPAQLSRLRRQHQAGNTGDPDAAYVGVRASAKLRGRSMRGAVPPGRDASMRYTHSTLNPDLTMCVG